MSRRIARGDVSSRFGHVTCARAIGTFAFRAQRRVPIIGFRWAFGACAWAPQNLLQRS